MGETDQCADICLYDVLKATTGLCLKFAAELDTLVYSSFLEKRVVWLLFKRE